MPAYRNIPILDYTVNVAGRLSSWPLSGTQHKQRADILSRLEFYKKNTEKTVLTSPKIILYRHFLVAFAVTCVSEDNGM